VIVRLPYRAFARVSIAPALVPQGVPRIRYRPVIPVRVHPASAATGPITIGDAFADPGSDFTILRGSLAPLLRLTSFVHHLKHRWQGRDYSVRFAEARLTVADASSSLTWPATVGFTDAPIPYGCLLGLSGFFEFFDVRFLGWRREMEIESNDLFARLGGVETP
jgi:hypothetical protein